MNKSYSVISHSRSCRRPQFPKRFQSQSTTPDSQQTLLHPFMNSVRYVNKAGRLIKLES